MRFLSVVRNDKVQWKMVYLRKTFSMNRLVIIGNGFDLAHGLPTSYRDFIDDYWASIKDGTHNDDFISFDNLHISEFKNVKNLETLAKYIMQFDQTIKYADGEIYRRYGNTIMNGHFPRAHILIYKNMLFKSINERAINNWVEIENEYYNQLKKIIKSKSPHGDSKLEEFWIGEQRKQVEKLNREFDEIKILFENYLKKVFFNQYDWNKMSNNEIGRHLIEEPNRQDFLLDKNEREVLGRIEDFSLKNTLLLSFNYTRTVEDYSKEFFRPPFYNYIHGKINSSDLPIIFGFGDEMDDNYKTIEDINDNEYLKNFKSIKYLEHSNYKQLYNFIESEPFQVFIMGHSCGLSDRTLLSTIFENTNCLSVKVFYHQKTKDSDNYTELVQNISRHFKDKKMLRKKVVEWKHCKPLIKFIGKQNDPQS